MFKLIIGSKIFNPHLSICFRVVKILKNQVIIPINQYLVCMVKPFRNIVIQQSFKNLVLSPIDQYLLDLETTSCGVNFHACCSKLWSKACPTLMPIYSDDIRGFDCQNIISWNLKSRNIADGYKSNCSSIMNSLYFIYDLMDILSHVQGIYSII